MVNIAGKKWLGLIFTISLLLNIIGATTFSLAESLRFDDTIESGRTGSNGNYTFKKHNIDWLACEVVSITRARESSPLRNGTVRMFTPSEISNASVYLSESLFQAAANNYVPNVKNTIFLKLRL